MKKLILQYPNLRLGHHGSKDLIDHPKHDGERGQHQGDATENPQAAALPIRDGWGGRLNWFHKWTLSLARAARQMNVRFMKTTSLLILTLTLALASEGHATPLILGGQTSVTNTGAYNWLQATNQCACCYPFPTTSTNDYDRSWEMYYHATGCGGCVTNWLADTSNTNSMPDKYHDLTPLCPALPGMPATTWEFVEAAATLRPTAFVSATNALWSFSSALLPLTNQTATEIKAWLKTNLTRFDSNSWSVSETVDSSCWGNITLTIEGHLFYDDDVCGCGWWTDVETLKIFSEYNYLPDEAPAAISAPATINCSSGSCVNSGSLLEGQQWIGQGQSVLAFCGNNLALNEWGVGPYLLSREKIDQWLDDGEYEENQEMKHGLCGLGILAVGAVTVPCIAGELIAAFRMEAMYYRYLYVGPSVVAGRSLSTPNGCQVFTTLPTNLKPTLFFPTEALGSSEAWIPKTVFQAVEQGNFYGPCGPLLPKVPGPWPLP